MTSFLQRRAERIAELKGEKLPKPTKCPECGYRFGQHRPACPAGMAKDPRLTAGLKVLLAERPRPALVPVPPPRPVGGPTQATPKSMRLHTVGHNVLALCLEALEHGDSMRRQVAAELLRRELGGVA